MVVVVRRTAFTKLGGMVGRRGQGALDNEVALRAAAVTFSTFFSSVGCGFLVLSCSA
jgi:hypothetical protein